MSELAIKEYNDGTHVRPAIVADNDTSFVILGKDGQPLFLVNTFDQGHGQGTCDVFVPAHSRSRVMLFGWKRQVAVGSDQNGRSWIEYGGLVNPEEPDQRHWGSPHAILNQGQE